MPRRKMRGVFTFNEIEVVNRFGGEACLIQQAYELMVGSHDGGGTRRSRCETLLSRREAFRKLDQIAQGGSVHEADCTAQVRISKLNNAKAYAEVECIRHRNLWPAG